LLVGLRLGVCVIADASDRGQGHSALDRLNRRIASSSVAPIQPGM